MSATKDEKVGEGPLLTLYELTAEPDAELVPSPTGTLVKWSDLDSLLADGTLRLVETVTPEPDAENPKLLKHCGEIVADDWGYRAVFCPKCGSRIAYP